MRIILSVIVSVFLLSVVVSGCSTPSSDTSKYFPENESGNSQIEDITTDQTGKAVSTEEAPLDPTEKYKTAVSPSSISKLEAQYQATMYLLEEAKADFKKHKIPDYKFKISEQAFINGNPLIGEEDTTESTTEVVEGAESKAVESDTVTSHVIGEVSPVALFKSWDSSKFTSVTDVESWAQNSVAVKIVGIRKNDDGNWYQVEVIQGGLVAIKGWINEMFISSTSGMDKEGFQSSQGVLEEGRGRRGGGGGGGG